MGCFSRPLRQLFLFIFTQRAATILFKSIHYLKVSSLHKHDKLIDTSYFRIYIKIYRLRKLLFYFSREKLCEPFVEIKNQIELKNGL
jgi:hypothetical protein